MKDKDSQQQLLRMQAAGYAIIPAGMAIACSMVFAHFSIWRAALLGIVVFLASLFIIEWLTNSSADAGGSLYHSSGASTPSLRQYSLAESLVARGKHDEAKEAYELLCDDFPNDPEPPLRLARLQRDKLNDYSSAAASFKRALAARDVDRRTNIAVTRELIELYTHKLRTPTAALPFLGRLAEAYPDDAVSAWAKAEYADIKQQILAEHTGG